MRQPLQPASLHLRERTTIWNVPTEADGHRRRQPLYGDGDLPDHAITMF
jgi:hypothetical protein